MKYFVAIALIATVASAAYVRPTPTTAEMAEIQEIVAAINNPSTNPATAAVLEEMLLDVLGIKPEAISVGPAIVDFPIAPSPVIVAPSPIAPSPIAPSPVAIVPGPVADVDVGSAPLVQIILNINEAAAESGSVAPAPVFTPEAIKPEPVHVVEFAPVQVVESAPVVAEPVQVVETAPVPVQPVQVVEVAPEPVQVVEVAPVPAEPVLIGTPVIPAPAINLPADLN